MCVVVVGKPNLVKDFCPRLPLDLDLDFVLGLGQAFQLDNIIGISHHTFIRSHKKNFVSCMFCILCNFHV